MPNYLGDNYTAVGVNAPYLASVDDLTSVLTGPTRFIHVAHRLGSPPT